MEMMSPGSLHRVDNTGGTSVIGCWLLLPSPGTSSTLPTDWRLPNFNSPKDIEEL